MRRGMSLFICLLLLVISGCAFSRGDLRPADTSFYDDLSARQSANRDPCVLRFSFDHKGLGEESEPQPEREEGFSELVREVFSRMPAIQLVQSPGTGTYKLAINMVEEEGFSVARVWVLVLTAGLVPVVDTLAYNTTAKLIAPDGELVGTYHSKAEGKATFQLFLLFYLPFNNWDIDKEIAEEMFRDIAIQVNEALEES